MLNTGRKRWCVQILLLAVLCLRVCVSISQTGTKVGTRTNIIANPINLNYQFQRDTNTSNKYREAADPVVVYFKKTDKYYLFASKSWGYWSSPDLVNWTYIPCKSIRNINGYAPGVIAIADTVYFTANNDKQFTPQNIVYKTDNPELDAWVDTETNFRGGGDNAFFQDDDGLVYQYMGLSPDQPIRGARIDPADRFRRMGNLVDLIPRQNQQDTIGWLIRGNNNEIFKDNKKIFFEGAAMNKHNGRYYLQFSAPGTQFRTYADGVYISDKPLGPFLPQKTNPYSVKPGGFIGGAGHGHTFQDKYGNYWHVSTMKISVSGAFERRIGLFPAFFAEDGELHSHTVLTDYPFIVPDKKLGFKTNDLSAGWRLLSYKKATDASSFLNKDYVPENANDELIESRWVAEDGEAGQWWMVDLAKPMRIQAMQINFADHNFRYTAALPYFAYQYVVEGSNDKTNWTLVLDERNNTKDEPHALKVLSAPQTFRYLRITNKKDLPCNFSLFGFRVFGKGSGSLPAKPSGVKIEREQADGRHIRISIDKASDVTGYIIRWGLKKDQLFNADIIYGNESFDRRLFDKTQKYFFKIEAFNENGITKGSTVYEASL